MCWACEQGDIERRFELVDIISTGKMPDGYSAGDLRAMGLPLPGELVREPQPDGTVVIRQVAPSVLAAAAAAFACDAPGTARKTRAPKKRAQKKSASRNV